MHTHAKLKLRVGAGWEIYVLFIDIVYFGIAKFGIWPEGGWNIMITLKMAIVYWMFAKWYTDVF